jgi:hypothetical protein
VPVDRRIVAVIAEALHQRATDRDFSLTVRLVDEMTASPDVIGEFLMLAVRALERLGDLEDRDPLNLLREAVPPR